MSQLPLHLIMSVMSFAILLKSILIFILMLCYVGMMNTHKSVSFTRVIQLLYRWEGTSYVVKSVISSIPQLDSQGITYLSISLYHIYVLLYDNPEFFLPLG